MPPFSRTPPVTKAILLLNLAAFAFAWPLAPTYFGGMQSFLDEFGLLPSRFRQGAFWQPLTSMFLHIHLLHIGVNMLGVWSIGSVLERGIGPSRFIGLYLFSGLMGGLAVAFFQPILPGYNPVSVTIGASGALLGLLGAIAVLHPNSMLLLFFFPVKARTAAFLIGAISLGLAISGYLGGISHLGHLGGLVGGLLYTWLAISREKMENRIDEQYSAWNDRRGADPREEFLRGFPDDRWRGFGSLRNPWREDGPREKVINPRPEEQQPEGRRRHIYYDPFTGRYIVIYR